MGRLKKSVCIDADMKLNPTKDPNILKNLGIINQASDP